jgi:hypothetical protein
VVMSFDGPDTLLSMLNEECEAIAAEVGAWPHNSPCQQHDPVPGERIALCVSQLGSLLKSQVTLTKARTLEEVQAGRRALVVHLDTAHPGSLIALAADYAGIGDAAKRLVGHGGMARLFNGYALLSEGDQRRVLFPPIQRVLENIEHVFAQATKTPSGASIVAETTDGLRRVTLQVGYPAYYVYELEERPVAQGVWQSVARTGRDQLVSLLADAYHKGYWFARQGQEDVVWRPR